MESASQSLGLESASAAEGPVLSLMNKRLRALRKKYNRILQMETNLAQGKTLNKEQEEVLRSKPGVVALMDEYEKLRQPLAAAVLEEHVIASSCASSGSPNPVLADSSLSIDSTVEGLLSLLYFGRLFDVKPQSEFTSMMLTRTHERGCCLTYDYVTDDATELLGEKDLDMISAVGELVTSRPLYSGISHRCALERCIQHAKLWLLGDHQPIAEGSSATYSVLREKLNKILASDYYTTTPEMKDPVDVAAAASKYNVACQVLVSDLNDEPAPDLQTEAVEIDCYNQEDEQENFQAGNLNSELSGDAYDLQKDEADDSDLTFGDVRAPQEEQQILEEGVEHNIQRDYEQTDQHHISQRPFQNLRGRGGRRGYSNARGRNGRGGGYQNDLNQYFDPGYHQRGYFNTRGRAERSGGSAMFNHSPSIDDLGASAKMQSR